jgi:hypothetical protein
MFVLRLQHTDPEDRTSPPFIVLVSLFQGVHTEGARHMGRSLLQGRHLDQQCSLQNLTSFQSEDDGSTPGQTDSISRSYSG